MLTLNSPQTVQETAQKWKKESNQIALVPTMGCLHEGHLQLVQMAKKYAEKVVVSIFVNPLQFGPNEDFEKYPRAFEQDSAKLAELGVDLLFYPSVKDLYPDGFCTKIKVGALSERLCGQFRPGHFDGVATVCLKLFEVTQADFAVFGQKDFQQLKVIERMARDFNLPVTILPHPTVRASDSLALSSRNTYLSDEERQWAQKIPAVLKNARQLISENPFITVSELKSRLIASISTVPLKLQYLEVTKTKDLEPTSGEEKVVTLPHPHLFIAAFAGSTRLIDNITLNGG